MPCHSGIFIRHFKYRLCRKRRTVGPDFTDEIHVCAQRCTAFFSQFLIKTIFPQADGAAVKTKRCPALQMALNKRMDIRNTGLIHFHKLEPGTLKLTGGLQKIASVSPETGEVR